MFDHSFASSGVTYRESSKQNTVAGLRADELVHGYYVVGSRKAGAWTALHDIDLTNAKSLTLSLGSTNPASAKVEVRVGAPDGQKIAELAVSATGVSQYSIPGAVTAGDIPVKELAYTDVTADLPATVTGVHDVYLVFTDRDVRVRDLTLQARVTPTVDISVVTKCTAGKVFVNVTAKNTSAFATDITIDTPYGNKTFPGVAPGKNAFQSFTTRQKTIPAGEATITSAATVDGVPVSATTTAALPATTCN